MHMAATLNQAQAASFLSAIEVEQQLRWIWFHRLIIVTNFVFLRVASIDDEERRVHIVSKVLTSPLFPSQTLWPESVSSTWESQPVGLACFYFLLLLRGFPSMSITFLFSINSARYYWAQKPPIYVPLLNLFIYINSLSLFQRSFSWRLRKFEESIRDSWQKQRWLHIEERTAESSVWLSLLPGWCSTQYSTRQVCINPLIPKIYILPPGCYTFPC